MSGRGGRGERDGGGGKDILLKRMVMHDLYINLWKLVKRLTKPANHTDTQSP